MAGVGSCRMRVTECRAGTGLLAPSRSRRWPDSVPFPRVGLSMTARAALRSCQYCASIRSATGDANTACLSVTTVSQLTQYTQEHRRMSARESCCRTTKTEHGRTPANGRMRT
jgi:hypothetical protein